MPHTQRRAVPRRDAARPRRYPDAALVARAAAWLHRPRCHSRPAPARPGSWHRSAATCPTRRSCSSLNRPRCRSPPRSRRTSASSGPRRPVGSRSSWAVPHSRGVIDRRCADSGYPDGTGYAKGRVSRRYWIAFSPRLWRYRCGFSRPCHGSTLWGPPGKLGQAVSEWHAGGGVLGATGAQAHTC